MRIPSAKSVIEKPAISKYKNRPIRIAMVNEIMPMDSVFSLFSCINFASHITNTFSVAKKLLYRSFNTCILR